MELLTARPPRVVLTEDRVVWTLSCPNSSKRRKKTFGPYSKQVCWTSTVTLIRISDGRRGPACLLSIVNDYRVQAPQSTLELIKSMVGSQRTIKWCVMVTIRNSQKWSIKSRKLPSLTSTSKSTSTRPRPRLKITKKTWMIFSRVRRVWKKLSWVWQSPCKTFQRSRRRWIIRLPPCRLWEGPVAPTTTIKR